MSEPLIVEITIDAPAEAVWRALRDPAELRRWHGWEYDGDALADEIRVIYLDGVTVSDEEMTLDTGAGRFALERQGEQTVVRLTRAAPAGRESWDGVYDEVNEGWITFVHQLRFALERQRGRDRRTAMVEHPVPLPDGEPWLRTANQAGVVVEDGCVLVVATPARTVISGYGFDEPGFAAVAERIAGR